MWPRLGLAILYFIAVVYIVLILWPCLYCLQHGCRGPAELDAFLPAFALTPLGAIATAFSLRDAIRQIRKTTTVLGFLAACNYFRDRSPRCDCSYSTRDLSHSISSLRAGC